MKIKLPKEDKPLKNAKYLSGLAKTINFKWLIIVLKIFVEDFRSLSDVL